MPSEESDAGIEREREPRPIDDFLLRYELWQIFGAIALVSMLATFATEELGGPVWIGAMGSVWSLFGGAYVVLHFGWQRFKKWRYPTYYDQ